MSLDVAKLEKVRELAGGIVQARCPACAEGGHDRSGEHLRIYPDGKFGCCVHPKDGEHRKRIWALAGCKGKLPFPSGANFSLRLKVLAHGQPAALPAQSVKAALTAGPPRTAKTELQTSVPAVPTAAVIELRTGRTTEVKLCARAREDCIPTNIDTANIPEQLKDPASAVRAALGPSGLAPSPPVVAKERLPYLTAGGTLVIPMDSPERYHWWKLDGERLSVAEVRAELATPSGGAS